ncbi:MAG TPA: hypothetical protein ENG74_00125 [Thermoplasmatales archaeon]|nr:hypothetical protein [Thermoplasmatales archaeon]
MPKLLIKYIEFADYFSILNSIFGMIAILFILDNNLWMAGSLILLAVLSDGLDGLIARRYGGSRLGSYIDSLADLISFCMAPLLMVFVSYRDICPSYILVGAIAIYLLFSIIHLSTFLTTKQRGFSGLPTTAAGAFVVLVVLLLEDWYIPVILLLVVSILMVIDINYPKPKIWMNAVGLLLILLTVAFGSAWNSLFPTLLLLSFALYIFVMPLFAKFLY